MKNNARVGIGFDIHPLEKGRKLMLGGIHIPYDYGLSGWSDADVLTHAIIDALLGAAAMGDIGQHFPPGHPEYRDFYSLVLLEEISDKIISAGWRVVNIDATVVAEKPELSEYIKHMRKALSQTLTININQVSVKASTTNGLGLIGKGEGIAAYAVAMLEAEKR